MTHSQFTKYMDYKSKDYIIQIRDNDTVVIMDNYHNLAALIAPTLNQKPEIVEAIIEAYGFTKGGK
jgi:hypothetical protein